MKRLVTPNEDEHETLRLFRHCLSLWIACFHFIVALRNYSAAIV